MINACQAVVLQLVVVVAAFINETHSCFRGWSGRSCGTDRMAFRTSTKALPKAINVERRSNWLGA